MENQELIHWGVKGMRWGVRRYQNRDGTLTPAGKKRYNKELERVRKEEKILKNKQATKAKIDRLNERKKAVEDGKRALQEDNKDRAKPKADAKPKVKTIKDMSDEEISAVIRRMRLEKEYKELTSTPKKVSAGEKFLKDTLLPKAVNVSTNLLTEYATKKGKELLGLTEKNDTAALKKKVEKLELNKKYKDLTSQKKDPLEDLRNEFNELNLKSNIKRLKKEEEEDK